MQDLGEKKDNIFKRAKDFVMRNLKSAFDLHEGTDSVGTIERISSGIKIRGANSWILICSAMLASIGLDVNSSAVIIGAMLISPLMSPILGIGLGYGIADSHMLIRSLRNFMLAILITLFVSTFYFTLTPMGELTSELMARTKPTLLDVFVAIFGGVAGIVANSRKEMSNAIPGVAIATALMPPLCTVGFGLAKGEWSVFFGAGYLFFINAVFIALSTYLMVRFLRFPFKKYIDKANKKKIQWTIGIVAVLIIAPSLYIFLDVINESRRDRAIQLFAEEISTERYDVIDSEYFETDSTALVKYFVIGEQMLASEINKYDSLFHADVLPEVGLQFVQMNLSEEERSSFRDEVMDVVSKNVLKQVSATKEIIDVKDVQIDSLIQCIDDIHFQKEDIAKVRNVLETYHPEVEKIYFGKIADFAHNDSTKDYYNYNIQTAMLKFKERTAKRTKLNSKKELQSFLQTTFAVDTMLVLEI
jgi:uncharacterized hydrophobic protein (TIGR00271 family)